jgi:hypothetical protein
MKIGVTEQAVVKRLKRALLTKGHYLRMGVWPLLFTRRKARRRADVAQDVRIPGHARLGKKLICLANAHAHARSHATSGTCRFESKNKNHAAKLQQRNVRTVQASPPGPGLARAKADGERRMAKDPKTRKLSLSRLSTRVALEAI